MGTVWAMHWLDDYTHIRVTYGSAAAFAALAASTPSQRAKVDAVAAGAPTTVLPAALGVAAVACMDYDRLPDVLATETRQRVLLAAKAAYSWHGVDCSDIAAMADHLASVETWRVPAMLKDMPTAELRTRVLEHVVTWGSGADGDTPARLGDRYAVTRAATIFASVPGLHVEPRHDTTAEQAAARARIVLGAAHAGTELTPVRSPGIDAADIAAAVELLDSLDRGDMRSQVRTRLACATWVHGGTPQRLAELAGAETPAEVDDATVARWLFAFADSYVNDGAGREPIRPLDELLEAVTDHGRIRRQTSRSFIHQTTGAVDVAVLAAFIPQAAGYADTFARMLTGQGRHRYDGDAVVAALAANPTLGHAVYQALADDPALEVPAAVTDAAMSAIGMAPWLDPNTGSANAQARLAVAGTGLSGAAWGVVWDLALDFRGTPEQLVAVARELTPDQVAA